MTALLVLGLVVLLALNVPVGFAMLAVSMAYVSLKADLPLIVAAQQVAAGSDKFLLLAIPFFFLAAEVMSSGGVDASAGESRACAGRPYARGARAR